MNLKKLRQLIGFPLDSASRSTIEKALVDEYFSAEILMGFVILIFQAIMIGLFIVGSPVVIGSRRMYYLIMYFSLFFITLIVLVTYIYFHRKKPEMVALQMGITFFFSFTLCFWACGITLLDHYKGSNMSVYSYVILAIAVFSLLKPWQSITVFGSGFLVLNVVVRLLCNNPLYYPNGVNTFGITVNSFFVFVMAVITSVTLYRSRVFKYADKLLIEAQVEEIQKINRKLNHLAMTDQLTNMRNRRYLEAKMDVFISDESTAERPCTGMMVDIDYFKQYNDTYGHQAGDICLEKLATTLKEFVKDKDGFAVRYGGEEFFLCLFGHHDVKVLAESLRLKVEKCCFPRKDLPIGYLTVSIGTDQEACLRNIGMEGFLHRCDKALYQAKNQGRNCVCIYDESLESNNLE